MQQHREGKGSLFVRQYGVTRLVYFEMYDDPYSAITREKQLKNGIVIGKSGSSRKKILNGKI